MRLNTHYDFIILTLYIKDLTFFTIGPSSHFPPISCIPPELFKSMYMVRVPLLPRWSCPRHLYPLPSCQRPLRCLIVGYTGPLIKRFPYISLPRLPHVRVGLVSWMLKVSPTVSFTRTLQTFSFRTYLTHPSTTSKVCKRPS